MRDWSPYDIRSISVFKWIHLDHDVDLGPVGKDLQCLGLALGVLVGPSWVLPVET